MKIGIISGPFVPVPPPKYGGTEQIIHFLIKGLKEAGHEPVLFGSADSTEDCEIIPIVDEALYFPKKQSEVEAHQAQVKKIQKKTEKILRENLPKLDIVHSHGFDLKNFQDFPNLTTIHNSVYMQDLPYYLERQNLFYVSISKNQQGSFPDLQYAGVVYNGENPDDFPFVEEPEDYVCFLGRFDEEKNPHLAIQVAINLGIKIKVAGKIDFRGEEYFKEQIEPLLDNSLVEYLGEIGFEEKVALLSKAKCNLHPTGFREPFGLTVLEAAYCGTPTLAIARGSMPELIEEGLTGMLVEDFVEGYHLIEKCFEMNRKYISQRSRRLFNYRTMSNQYVRAYEKVINLFHTRQEQLNIIRNMTKETENSIEEIWKNNRHDLRSI